MSNAANSSDNETSRQNPRVYRDLFGEKAPVGETSRGIPIWKDIPPEGWLREHEHFVIFTDLPPLLADEVERPIRLTFRKRYAERRKDSQSRSPSWNGQLHKQGQRKDVLRYDTISVYAGTSQTLPMRGLSSVIQKLKKQLNAQRIRNAKIERGEIEPTRHSPTARHRRPHLKKPVPTTDALI